MTRKTRFQIADAARCKRVVDANDRACRYLGNANEARERGNAKVAEFWEAKAQVWLDRLNELEGNS